MRIHAWLYSVVFVSIFLSFAFMLMSVSLSAHCVSFCVLTVGLCMYECVSAAVFFLFVCVCL